jgi:nucleotide-binding universal stress UspA family protein
MPVRRLEPGQVIGGFELEAPDPAAAILEYAVTNNPVGRIIVGAWASSGLRRYLGSVSVRVVAEAPCTVRVVRTN